eukprot:5251403-Prymnesium_polylepis.1
MESYRVPQRHSNASTMRSFVDTIVALLRDGEGDSGDAATSSIHSDQGESIGRQPSSGAAPHGTEFTTRIDPCLPCPGHRDKREPNQVLSTALSETVQTCPDGTTVVPL